MSLTQVQIDLQSATSAPSHIRHTWRRVEDSMVGGGEATGKECCP